MLRLDLICFTNSGISAIRMTSVSPMIDSTQAKPDVGPKMPPNSLWKPTSTAEIT